MRERGHGCLSDRMSEVTPSDNIGSMTRHDTLSFATAQGIIDALRVAPGWIYAWRGTHIAVMVPWNHCMDLAEGAERLIRRMRSLMNDWMHACATSSSTSGSGGTIASCLILPDGSFSRPTSGPGSGLRSCSNTATSHA